MTLIRADEQQGGAEPVTREAEAPRAIGALNRWRRNRVAVQLARYTLVSAVALIVDFGTLVALTELLKIHYLSSAAIAFILGLTTNYTLSILWVFDERAVRNRTAEFLGFALLGVVGLGLNEAVLLVLSGWCGIHYAISKFVATGVTFSWNFVSRKLLLFTVGAVKPLGSESDCAGSTSAIAMETVAAK
jgi:putative flippase GtrA